MKVTYDAKPHNVSEELEPAEWKTESERGSIEQAFNGAPVTVDETYVTPTETHAAIELHGTVATYENGTFTLYETSQAVVNHQQVAMAMLDEPKENVRVVSRFLGSGFGSKLWPWPHCFIAAVAAKQLGRPVKLVLSRKMNFEAAGHRPVTQQRIRLAADQEGRLVGAEPRLSQPHLNPRRLQGELRRGDALPLFHGKPARALGTRPPQCRHAHLHARPGRGARSVRAGVRDG